MLNNIKENEKYTLIIENSFGIMVDRKVKIIEAEEVKNPKYSYGDSKALRLIYIEKGKRKKSGTLFTENKIAIVEGWKDIKGTMKDNFYGEMISFHEDNFNGILELNNLNPVLTYNC
jgi:hypothetical protein